MTCNDVPTFVAGCYIPHHESSFYAYIDRDQPFLDLEEDIAFFKSKGEVIVMDDMNACTKTMKSDTQQSSMPCLSRKLFDAFCKIEHLRMQN